MGARLDTAFDRLGRRSVCGSHRRELRELRGDVRPEKLSRDEKRLVDSQWTGLQPCHTYDWHGWFKQVSGVFDPRYVAPCTYELSIIPRLQNVRLSQAWADKAYYCKRFPQVCFPEEVLYRINGTLLDCDHRIINANAALALVRRYRRVLVKPTIGGRVGRGVSIWDVESMDDDALEHALAESGSNYVVQDVIEQHELLARLNPSSCNIIRINTLRLGSDVFVLNSIVRFGVVGSCTDVSFIDGKEVLNIVGVTDDGRLHANVFDVHGRARSLETFNVAAGTPIPGFKQACDLAKQMHKELHHFGIVGFDVAIDRRGEPVVVEYNLTMPGVVFPQYAHGPFFGSLTDDVVQYLRTRTPDAPLGGRLL